MQRRIKEQHDRRVRATHRFRHVQWDYVDCPLFAIKTDDKLATESNLKLLPSQLSPHGVFSSTTKTVMIDDEGIQNRISFDLESLALQSEIDAFSIEANISYQSEYPKELL